MMAAVDPVTQDRVYRALKGEYLAGHFFVGARLDLQGIADRLRSSKTPVREAVHRLMGERLVESDPGGGFRICRPTRGHLVQLYAWNAHLLVALAQRLKASDLKHALDRVADMERADMPRQVASRAGAIFLSLAEATGNSETISTVAQMNERLFYMRIVEVTDLPDSIRELRILTNTAVADIHKTIRRRLEAYHERRIGQQRESSDRPDGTA